MAEEAVFGGEIPINSFSIAEAHKDDEREVDKHVISENHIEIDNFVMIDTNLLTVNSLISSNRHSVIYKGRTVDEWGAFKFIGDQPGNRTGFNKDWYKGDPVALKIKKPVSATDVDLDDHKDNILREITILSRVKHENLVKFIGASMHPVIVIVMEYMKGGSLKNYLLRIKTQGGLGLKQCISFALDISKAMEFLHINGIIHRNLNPDNLLLTRNPKKLKLGDFGLAREETVNEKMTAGVGTIRWMAPELFGEGSLKRGEKIYYDHKVDIYSFSMVFWEMLNNCMPFEGIGNFQAAYAVKHKNVRPSLEKVPTEIAPLLESCWAADPSHRPEFTQIIRALSEFLKYLDSSPNIPPQLVTIEEEEEEDGDGVGTGTGIGISQAAVVDSASSATVDNPLVVQEAEEVEASVDKYKSSLSSKFYNFFCVCFSKSSSLPEALQGIQ